MTRKTRVSKTPAQKKLAKWDLLNAYCNGAVGNRKPIGTVKPWREFKLLLKKKKPPMTTFMVSNEADNHVALYRAGKLYNPNDYTEIERDKKGKIVSEDDSLPHDGFEHVVPQHRPLLARSSRLNTGEGGICRLACLCMLSALKTDKGRADLINMDVKDFVKEYATKNIKKYMQSIGI